MLCHRGCGLKATFTNYLGEPCCSPKAPSCPVIKKKIGQRSGASRKGKTYDELHGENADAMRKLRSEQLTGRPVSESSKEKSRNSNKKHSALNPKDPWNKGKIGLQVPWNKGKSGYTLPARKKLPNQDYAEYQKYKRAVYYASRKTYKQNISLLNPTGLTIGRSGTINAYQIDHIIPISKGYELKIPVTAMADSVNLQLLPWKSNRSKSHSTDENILFLVEKLLSKYSS